MNSTIYGIVLCTIIGLGLGLPLGQLFYNMELQKVQATGGAGEIKGLIDPMIARAIEALQNNNTELALEEIQTLQNELNDTFSIDQEEEEEEKEDEDD